MPPRTAPFARRLFLGSFFRDDTDCLQPGWRDDQREGAERLVTTPDGHVGSSRDLAEKTAL
jgi:hypothetical protein